MWTDLKILCAIILLSLVWLLIYPHVMWYPGNHYYYWLLPQEDICYNAIVFLQNNIWGYLPLALFVYGLLSIFLRPRHLVIDTIHRTAKYTLPVIGSHCYYFVEFQGIQIETDMSKVLLRLNSPKLYFLYLKLHRGKTLLISQDMREDAILDLAHKLQKVLNLENIEHMHRVGNKRGQEIQLGNYVVEKELSHGGMGKVLLAKDRRNQTRVALKILPASLALRKNYITNFARETRVLQKLSHPGIVKIYDVGRDTDRGRDVYFYAMEYIEGKTLSEMIKAKELNYRKSVQFVLEVALALDYIHKHAIVHRDIKPSNIMIREDGSVALIDFGIARIVAHQAPGKYYAQKDVDISHYVGTPPYMSPEQISSSKTIDYRTDIYSLGVSLYEMLTGKRPFRGGGNSVYRAILTHYPPQPSSIKPDIPHELDIITMRAMEKNKHQRYYSGAEFAEDIYRWLHEMPILSREIHWWIVLWRRFRSFFRWLWLWI